MAIGQVTNVQWDFDPPSNGHGDDIACLTVTADTPLGELEIVDSASEVRSEDGLDREVTLGGRSLDDVDLPDFGLSGSTSPRAIANFKKDMGANLNSILADWWGSLPPEVE